MLHLLSPSGPLIYSSVVSLYRTSLCSAVYLPEGVRAEQASTVLLAEWAQRIAPRQVVQIVHVVQLGEERGRIERCTVAVLDYWRSGEAALYRTVLYTLCSNKQYSTVDSAVPGTTEQQKARPNAPDTARYTVHETLQSEHALRCRTALCIHSARAADAGGGSRVS